MKLAWFTDIHLDMPGNLFERVQKLNEMSGGAEVVLISGDISVSNSLIPHLNLLEQTFQKPIYFVLGNHDYYNSNIGTVRKSVAALCNSSTYLKYMPMVSNVLLEKGTYLVGHDGWYDAQNGNPYGNDILMTDWIKISDFNAALRSANGGRLLNKDAIMDLSRKLTQQAVNHVANGIKSIVKDSRHIIVMTHVPPFKESFNGVENHRGIPVTQVLPWYTSKLMGDTLMAAAKAYPNVKFTVLSGHSHSHYDNDLLNNLTVKVGKAVYGNPQLASSLSI